MHQREIDYPFDQNARTKLTKQVCQLMAKYPNLQKIHRYNKKNKYAHLDSTNKALTKSLNKETTTELLGGPVFLRSVIVLAGRAYIMHKMKTSPDSPLRAVDTGAFGGVYRLEDVQSKQRTLCVKVMDLETIAKRDKSFDVEQKCEDERLILEKVLLSAGAWTRVNRRDHNKYYLFMDWLSGNNLKDYIYYYFPMAKKEKQQIIIELLYNLTKLHARGILHGDISAENVMINFPFIQFLDYGFSKELNCFEIEASSAGKPGYVGLEILKKGFRNHKSDVLATSRIIAMLYDLETFNNENIRSVSFMSKKQKSSSVVHFGFNAEAFYHKASYRRRQKNYYEYELIRKMGATDHNERPTAKEAFTSYYYHNQKLYDELKKLRMQNFIQKVDKMLEKRTQNDRRTNHMLQEIQDFINIFPGVNDEEQESLRYLMLRLKLNNNLVKFIIKTEPIANNEKDRHLQALLLEQAAQHIHAFLNRYSELIKKYDDCKVSDLHDEFLQRATSIREHLLREVNRQLQLKYKVVDFDGKRYIGEKAIKKMAKIIATSKSVDQQLGLLHMLGKNFNGIGKQGDKIIVDIIAKLQSLIDSYLQKDLNVCRLEELGGFYVYYDLAVSIYRDYCSKNKFKDIYEPVKDLIYQLVEKLKMTEVQEDALKNTFLRLYPLINHCKQYKELVPVLNKLTELVDDHFPLAAEWFGKKSQEELNEDEELDETVPILTKFRLK